MIYNQHLPEFQKSNTLKIRRIKKSKEVVL